MTDYTGEGAVPVEGADALPTVDEVLERAHRERAGDEGERPPDATDATVAAVGKLREAYEWLIRARGHLYSFHQQMGRVDLLFGDASDALREAGHPDEADRIELALVGRNVVDGRWTFQVVEEFDDGYWEVASRLEREVRDGLMGGRRHVFESEMKDRRITPGAPGHERRPGG